MVAHLISLEALVGFDKGIPYLHFFFYIVMEVLSHMLDVVANAG